MRNERLALRGALVAPGFFVQPRYVQRSSLGELRFHRRYAVAQHPDFLREGHDDAERTVERGIGEEGLLRNHGTLLEFGHNTKVSTVFSAFEQTANANSRRPFLLVYPQRTELTYGAALERVATIASRYRARNYGKGHRVALRLPNHPEFLLHFLALNSLGASVLPLNPDYRSAELDYVLAHSEAGAVIDASTLEDPPPPGKDCGAEECALLYTSGTTGKPKGCLLSNFYFLELGRRYISEGGLCALREGEQ